MASFSRPYGQASGISSLRSRRARAVANERLTLSEQTEAVRAEVVSDENFLGPFTVACVAQSVLALHMAFGLVYATLALADTVFFDFVGMLNWWCTLLVLFVVIEMLAYVVYTRMTRTPKSDFSNPQAPQSVVGKPMIREINLGVVASLFAVLFTTLVCALFVNAGHVTYGVVGTEDALDSSGRRAYFNHLIAFFAFVLFAFIALVRAVIVHFFPINTITSLAKVNI